MLVNNRFTQGSYRDSETAVSVSKLGDRIVQDTEIVVSSPVDEESHSIVEQGELTKPDEVSVSQDGQCIFDDF